MLDRRFFHVVLLVIARLRGAVSFFKVSGFRWFRFPFQCNNILGGINICDIY